MDGWRKIFRGGSRPAKRTKVREARRRHHLRLFCEVLEDRRMLTTNDIGIFPSAADAYEGGASGSFYLARGGDLSQPATFFLEYSGTAGPLDYEPPPRSVTIETGWSMAMIDIHPIDDLLSEPTETVIVTLADNSLPAGYVVGSNTVTIQLHDNDPLVLSVEATDGSASEEINPATGLPDPGVFTITRTGSTASSLTVAYALPNGPQRADNGVDYETLTGSVTIPSGSSTAEVIVRPIDDNALEGPEFVYLQLTGASATTYKLSETHSTAYLTLNDDDLVPANRAPTDITLTNSSVEENRPRRSLVGMFQGGRSRCG
jgi:hypothetical protein